MSLSVLSVIQSVFQPVHHTDSNHLQQLPTRISQSARKTTARTINEMSAAQDAMTANDGWREEKSTRIKKGRAWYKITTKTSWRRQEVMTEVAHARYPPYTPTSDNVPPNAPKQQVRLFGGWSGHQIQQYKRTYGHSQTSEQLRWTSEINLKENG